MKTTECQLCGKRFEYKTNKSKYCTSCRDEAKKIYLSINKKRLYKNHRERYRQGKYYQKRPKREIKCCDCGEIFYSINWRVVRCETCRKEYKKKYQRENAKKWYENNKEKVKEKYKKYWQDNKDVLKIKRILK